MSITTIEARAAALMSMHKEELTRAIAHFEQLTGHLVDEVESAAKRMLGIEEPAPAMEQGTDPEITDVPPASTEPEPLTTGETLAALQAAGEDYASEPAAAVEGADAAPAEEPAKPAKKAATKKAKVAK